MDETLTEEERAWLETRCPKALRVIDAQSARLKAIESDVGYYVGKLDRIDALPLRWEEESDRTEDEGRKAALYDLGEELADILGGYRERVERLRAEGWTLPSERGRGSDGQDVADENEPTAGE